MSKIHVRWLMESATKSILYMNDVHVNSKTLHGPAWPGLAYNSIQYGRLAPIDTVHAVHVPNGEIATRRVPQPSHQPAGRR